MFVVVVVVVVLCSDINPVFSYGPKTIVIPDLAVGRVCQQDNGTSFQIGWTRDLASSPNGPGRSQ